MNYKAFKIRNITNMHVGSGDNTFGIVDKMVQRDLLTGYPVIYSSSLKGGLKEFFSGIMKDDESVKKSDFIKYVFGGDDKENGESTAPGTYRFFQANLLAIPVRSNCRPYYMATTLSILKEFIATLDTFGIDHTGFNDIKTINALVKSFDKDKDDKDKNAQKEVFIRDSGKGTGVKIEDWQPEKSKDIPEKIDLFGSSDIALFSEAAFKELVKCLPVIARNNLENGQSTNLWYEEVVPRESLFYFIVGEGNNGEYSKYFEEKIDSFIVQIGANASIGYGYTKISLIDGGNSEQKSK